MSRIPPGLLYLTIYNPSLRPTSLTSPDDEDAQEQAQILFYTARERAVSRDRILRQVGLAKALVNFSDMFNSEQACENVHSQTRRMMSLELEPDYWIHACVELAKTPRSVPPQRKGNEKGKAKNDNVAVQEQVFDYHDSSVHDVALLSQIKRGYEDFRLIHGSFASILSSLGQQVLELQLERFFTVWAWKWDIEQHTHFAIDLGAPLHPLAPALRFIIDDFAEVLPLDTDVFVLAPPYVIPSTLFNTRKFPSSLVRYVVSRIPPPAGTRPMNPRHPPAEQSVAKELIPVPGSLAERGFDPSAVVQITQKSVESATVNSFMAMANVTRAMDPRQLKWSWPGYLSFGKTASMKSPDTPQSLVEPQSNELVTATESSPNDSYEGKTCDEYLDVPDRHKSVELDRESLQEALSDNQSIASPRRLSPSIPSEPVAAAEGSTHEGSYISDGGVEPGAVGEYPGIPADTSEAPANLVPQCAVPFEDKRAQSPAPPLPALCSTIVHLSDAVDTVAMHKRRVWQFTDDELTVVMMTDHESAAPLDLVPRAMAMAISLREELATQRRKGVDEQTMPSATNILQPQSAHVLASNGYTISSSRPLPRNPEHLYHAKQMFQSDHDVYEVFSRGQNPQHWHVAKRRLEVAEEADHAQIYMEITRKESMLTDADNEAAAVVREFAEHEDGWSMLTS